MILKKSKSQQGFTLIELLIVMAILAMLAGIVGPTLINKVGGAKVDTAKTQIKNIETSLDAYRLDVGKYPRSLDGLINNESNSKLWAGPYIKKGVPKDPWGDDYQYRQPGKHSNDYDLFSYGADGKEGGADDDADVINW
jgi:general secretion pathway protein G